MLNWPIVIVTTVVLYVLMLITLPFSGIWATIYLFALIAFWSRLPGVGMPSPLYVLYLADFVDIFSVIIAVNVGGVPAAIFSLFCNLVSRVAGVFPDWLDVIKDSGGQAIACLILPFIFPLIGSNILIAIIVYTIIRFIVEIPMDFAVPDRSLAQYFVLYFGAGGALILINSIYATIFGSFLNHLLEQGMKFSWTLFFIATAVIIIFYVSVFGSSKTITLKQSLRFVNAVATKAKKAVTTASTQKQKSRFDPHAHEIDEFDNIKRNI